MPRIEIAKTITERNLSVIPSAFIAGDAVNGMYVIANRDDKLILHVKNADAVEHTVTILEDVATIAGDLVVVIAAGAETLIGPLESARFEQSDEAIYVDLDASTSVTLGAIGLP